MRASLLRCRQSLRRGGTKYAACVMGMLVSLDIGAVIAPRGRTERLPLRDMPSQPVYAYMGHRLRRARPLQSGHSPIAIIASFRAPSSDCGSTCSHVVAVRGEVAGREAAGGVPLVNEPPALSLQRRVRIVLNGRETAQSEGKVLLGRHCTGYTTAPDTVPNEPTERSASRGRRAITSAGSRGRGCGGQKGFGGRQARTQILHPRLVGVLRVLRSRGHGVLGAWRARGGQQVTTCNAREVSPSTATCAARARCSQSSTA